MSVNWMALAKRSGLQLDDRNRIIVPCGDTRKHTIAVSDAMPDLLRLTGVVARPVAAANSGMTDIDLWTKNRYRELVGFKFDSRRRIIGESFVPTAGLTTEEFEFMARTLAKACDHLEYVLTGRDDE